MIETRIFNSTYQNSAALNLPFLSLSRSISVSRFLSHYFYLFHIISLSLCISLSISYSVSRSLFHSPSISYLYRRTLPLFLYPALFPLSPSLPLCLRERLLSSGYRNRWRLDSSPVSAEISRGFSLRTKSRDFELKWTVVSAQSSETAISLSEAVPPRARDRWVVPMAGVIRKFFFASMFMWIIPIAIIYGFNHQMFPGLSKLSSSSQTLLSGFLAVISVNLVIACYIIMALKEPSNNEHQPDPAFLADAKASISHLTAEKREDSALAHDKEE